MRASSAEWPKPAVAPSTTSPNPRPSTGFLTQEVGEALEIALPEAEVVLEGLDDVEVGSPNGYLLTRKNGHWSVGVGSLLSGQELSFLLDLRFPRGRAGRKVTSTLRLVSNGEIAACEPASLQWTWASEEKNASQPVDRALRMERAELETHRIRQDAILLNRRNELAQSVQAILDGAERIRRHSLDDPADPGPRGRTRGGGEGIPGVAHLWRREGPVRGAVLPNEGKGS